MKKNLFLSAIILFSSILILNSSCKKKEDDVVVDDETQSVVDNSVCEQEFMRLAPEVSNKGAGSPKAAGFKTNGCGNWICLGVANPSLTPNITIDTTTNQYGMYVNGPVKFIADYSTVCIPLDGVTRTGTVVVVSTGHWKTLNPDSGYVDITFSGYKVGLVTYTGKIHITRPTLTSIRTVVTNGHCSAGTWNIDYAADKTVSVDANLTASIYGTSSGTNRAGVGFTVNTPQSSPLIKKVDCKWITSGVLELTPAGRKTRTVDYGNGTCDNKATFTVNGNTISFDMD